MKRNMIPLLVIFLLTVVAVPVFADDVDLDFNMDSGTVTILHTGEDTTFWHSGQVGESNFFSFSGDVIGSYDSIVQGPYGGLHTTINAYTDTYGGSFVVTDYQDFNVLSANHIYDVEGYFAAGASGSYAEINMDIHPSMYVWSEHDSGGQVLVGQSIYKNAWVTQNDVLQGDILIGVTTTGQAQLWNGAAWGFGISEAGSVTADYGAGLNYVSASGFGTLSQTVFGNDYCELNGIVFSGGGTYTAGGIFLSGMTGTYTMDAN